MATISEVFSTGEVGLSTTTADRVTLAGKRSHKVRVDNLSGAEPLYLNVLGHGIADTGAVKAQGTLTIAGTPEIEQAAAGTLTIAEPVTDGDTFTVDDKAYTLEATLSDDAEGQILVGADEAATKVNIVAAINGTGSPGTDYSTLTLVHPTVSAAAFDGDACVLTARTAGTAGNSLVSTETFTHVSNVFDAVTLGTTTNGLDNDTWTIGTETYTAVAALNPANSNEFISSHGHTNPLFSQLYLLDMFNRSGVYDGITYSAHTTIDPAVTLSAFAGNVTTITAVLAGTAGNAIVTTETFDNAGNLFDAATLGTETAGAAPVPTAATAAADHFVVPPGGFIELNSKALSVDVNGLECSIVGSGNDYSIQLLS
jgi:hypothetical protein